MGLLAVEGRHQPLLRYVPTYAAELTNNEAGNSKYVLTLTVNE